MISLGTKLFKNFQFQWLADDMKENLVKEIDFLNDVKNCEKIEPLLKGLKVKVPKFYKNLCTSKVITMEFIDGYSITDKKRLKNDGISLNEIALNLS